MTDPRQDYLAAYRRSTASPPETRASNLRAVLDRGAAIDDVPAQPARWAAALLVLKITTVTVLSGGVGWGVVTALWDDAAPPPSPVSVAETPDAPPVVPPVVRPAAAAGIPSAEPVEEPRLEEAPVRRARPNPSATDTVADELREELALLEAAQSHLRAGQHSKATASLREHARRFPQGALSTERSAWRAIVACSSGGSQPQAAARTFVLTHGDTPLAAKVKAECKL